MSAESHDITLPLSSPMEQAEGTVEMGGEVEFSRDTKSKLMKAVSGTEWMYRIGALKGCSQVSVWGGYCVCCVCVCMCVCVCNRS